MEAGLMRVEVRANDRGRAGLAQSVATSARRAPNAGTARVSEIVDGLEAAEVRRRGRWWLAGANHRMSWIWGVPFSLHPGVSRYLPDRRHHLIQVRSRLVCHAVSGERGGQRLDVITD